MKKIRQLLDQLGSPAYRWLFLFNGLGLILAVFLSYLTNSPLRIALTLAVGNLIIILIQCSVNAYWIRTIPLHRRTDDPEL